MVDWISDFNLASVLRFADPPNERRTSHSAVLRHSSANPPARQASSRKDQSEPLNNLWNPSSPLVSCCCLWPTSTAANPWSS